MAIGGGVELDDVLEVRFTSAHEVEQGDQRATGGRDPSLIGVFVGECINQPVIPGEDQDEVVTEEAIEPESDKAFDPVGVELVADIAAGEARPGNAFDLAQNLLGLRVERAGQQLPFVVDRHTVGALRRRQHRDDDANDGDSNDHPDRDHHAEARAIPTGWLTMLKCAWPRHSQQASCPRSGAFPSRQIRGQKLAER